jgi:hypothetical protein
VFLVCDVGGITVVSHFCVDMILIFLKLENEQDLITFVVTSVAPSFSVKEVVAGQGLMHTYFPLLSRS